METILIFDQPYQKREVLLNRSLNTYITKIIVKGCSIKIDTNKRHIYIPEWELKTIHAV